MEHKIGDTITSSKLGLKGRSLRVWDACPTCGTERWIRLNSKGINCRVCAALSRISEKKTTNHASIVWVNGQEPKVGDMALLKDIGRRGKGYCLWTLCPDCGKGRWVSRKQHSLNRRCTSCANALRLKGETNPRWNNGVRYSPGHGYYVRVKPDNLYYKMSISAGGQRYIAEHRLIMAMHVNRILEKWEVVHHINGDNLDNRLENLELLPKQTNHLPYNILQTEVYKLKEEVSQLKNRVTQVEAENTLLRAQLDGTANPEPSRSEISPGVCRDLTGDALEKGQRESPLL